MKPVFALRNFSDPHFVDPANANFAVVSPPFNGVDVGKIPPRVAEAMNKS